MKTYKVVLAKAGWCGHCVRFMPVFEEACERDISGYKNIIFEPYDLESKDNPTEKINFENSYPELKDKVLGFPTIFIIIHDEKDNKMIAGTIDHTEPVSDKKKDLNEAVQRFLNNIVNGFKTLESNGKSLFIESSGENKIEDKQSGGSKCCTISDTINYSSYNSKTSLDYKSKYLKYKSKYLQLKK